MANEHQAFLFVMGHEDPTLSGVVVTDNNGGQVRFGVNSKSNPQAVADGFYTMPVQDALDYAEKLFVSKYWDGIRGDAIQNQRVANQFVDLYYLSGDEIVKIVQRIVSRINGLQIAVDGICGPITVASINSCPDQLVLLDAIKAQAIVFFQNLVKQNPIEYSELDYRSWVRRLNA